MKKVIISIVLGMLVVNLSAKKASSTNNSYKASSYTQTKKTIKKKQNPKKQTTVYTIGSEVNGAVKKERKRVVDHVHNQAQQALEEAIQHQTQEAVKPIRQKVDGTINTFAYHVQPAASKIDKLIRGGMYYLNAGTYYIGSGMNYVTGNSDPYKASSYHNNRR